MTGDTILVVGGAGYIGSHMVKLLQRRGFPVMVVDNLVGGRREAVTGNAGLHVGEMGDPGFIDTVMDQTQPVAVMHFASFIQVGESVTAPHLYYQNNLMSTLVLLDAMRRHQVQNFIFSSTAAVYGDPVHLPIDENHTKNPINPYGRSKWMVEQVLQDYASAYGLRFFALRYFNAAGADPEGELGECHQPETHLIPLVLQVAAGRRPHIAIFGADYPTPDGTCIRDYIHVTDLCEAHLLALKALLDGAGSRQYNLGTGTGNSVAEVIATAQAVCGRPIRTEILPRRPGDPPVLVADSLAMVSDFGWRPVHGSLETIIRHAWQWEVSHFGKPSVRTDDRSRS